MAPKRKKKQVNLSVGRGEKRSVKQGGGLTAKAELNIIELLVQN